MRRAVNNCTAAHMGDTKKGKRFSRHTKAMAVRAYKANIGISTICEEVGVSRQMLRNWLIKDGVERDRYKRLRLTNSQPTPQNRQTA